MSLANFAQAKAPENPCKKLPNNTTIKVGCSDDCDSMDPVLQEASDKLGISYELMQLTKPEDLDKVDAYLSPGGPDPDPKYYTKNVTEPSKLDLIKKLHAKLGNDGQKKPEFDKRDALDSGLLKRYLASDRYANLPFLGVCYGMQMLAATEGIPLVVDIKSQLKIENRLDKMDQIILLPGSTIAKIANVSGFSGAENHHQAVDMEYWNENSSAHPTVKITATSNKGKIPEVIELTNRPAMGLQYHAEETANDSAQAPFSWLLENACIRKANPNGMTSSEVSAPATETSAHPEEE